MTSELVELIQNVRFTPVRLGEGYDMGEVDYFLDRLEAAALRDEPIGPILDAATFKQVRLREGYEIEDVDAFLAGLRTWKPTPVEAAPAPTPTPAPAPTPAPPVIVERRGFLARLFGRRR